MFIEAITTYINTFKLDVELVSIGKLINLTPIYLAVAAKWAASSRRLAREGSEKTLSGTKTELISYAVAYKNMISKRLF
jgi:hypothetical protein